MDAADALLDMIRAAVAEDDWPTVMRSLEQLDEVEPASADVIRKVLAFTEGHHIGGAS